MTFEELKQLDKFLAFENYITVKEAKDKGVIPPYYKNIFPDTCECGSENIINYDLTKPMCCNPRCRIKIGITLAEIIAKVGYKGVGESTCMNFVNAMYKDLEHKSVVDLLMIPFKKYPTFLQQTVAGSKLYDACCTIIGNEVTFPQMVSLLKIPTLDATAESLLNGIDSLEQFLFYLKETGSFTEFCNNRGVYDRMKIFYLYNFIPDIFIAEKVFSQSLRKQGLNKINICITGSLHVDGENITRNNFIKLCNTVGKDKDGRQIVEVKNTSAYESVPYIIADYPANTAKYLVGKRRNVLITAQEFIDKIREVINQ